MENSRKHQLSSVCLVVPLWLAVNENSRDLRLEICSSEESLHYKLHTSGDLHSQIKSWCLKARKWAKSFIHICSLWSLVSGNNEKTVLTRILGPKFKFSNIALATEIFHKKGIVGFNFSSNSWLSLFQIYMVLIMWTFVIHDPEIQISDSRKKQIRQDGSGSWKSRPGSWNPSATHP